MKKAVIQSFNTQAHFLWDKIPTDIKPQYSPEELQHSLVEVLYSPLDGFKQKMKNLYCPTAPSEKSLKLYSKLSIWELKMVTNVLRVF